MEHFQRWDVLRKYLFPCWLVKILCIKFWKCINIYSHVFEIGIVLISIKKHLFEINRMVIFVYSTCNKRQICIHAVALSNASTCDNVKSQKVRYCGFYAFFTNWNTCSTQFFFKIYFLSLSNHQQPLHPSPSVDFQLVVG